MLKRQPCLPGIQVDGHAVHSLKGVTMQSFLQGNKQGRMASGRAESGHLNTDKQLILNYLNEKMSWVYWEITAKSLTSQISPQKTCLISCLPACKLGKKGYDVPKCRFFTHSFVSILCLRLVLGTALDTLRWVAHMNRIKNKIISLIIITTPTHGTWRDI